MKVILSRKGFDTSSGKLQNPVLPDGRMLSLPIPYDARLYEDSSAFAYDKIFYEQNTSYQSLISSLTTTSKAHNGKVFNKKWAPINEVISHPDPDINYFTYPNRYPNWRGLFGQKDCKKGALTVRPQSHLTDEGVGKGDIFLFFGRFRKVDENFRYRRGEREFHAIYSYLQIDEVINNPEIGGNTIEDWMRYHPHLKWSKEFFKENEHNTLYVAKKKLDLEGFNEMSGWGCFKFNRKLVLTAENETMSVWSLPGFEEKCRITKNVTKKATPSPWRDDGFFRSGGRGQEFVISETEATGNSVLKPWLKGILSSETWA